MFKNIHQLLSILSFIFFSSIICGQEFSKKYAFQHIENGLKQASITEIMEDSDGYIWFGTSNGVYKYNGSKFHHFKQEKDSLNSLSNGYIETMYEPENDYIHIGTSYGLNIYDKEINTIKPYPFLNKGKELNSKHITAIEKDNETLFVGTYHDGLYSYNIKSGSIKNYSLKPANNKIYNPSQIIKVSSLTKDKIVVVNKAGIFVLRKNGNIIAKHFVNNAIKKTLKIDNYHYVIGFENGEILDVKISKKNELNVKRISITPGYQILSLTEDKNGNYWIGSENNGLFIYSPTSEKITQLKTDTKKKFSLKNNSIWSLYKTKNDVIWLGTYRKGISFYDANYYKFKSIKNEPYNPKSLNNNTVNDFVEDKKGNLWIATDGGGLNYWDRNLNIFKHYSKSDKNLSTDVITNMLPIKNKNTLWLGSWNEGITIFNTNSKKYEVWNTENSFLLSNHVMDLLQDRKGRIWVVTLWGGVQYYYPNTKKHNNINLPYSTNGALASENSRNLFEDSAGNIWVATINSGAIKLTEESEDQWSTKQYHKTTKNQAQFNGFINTIIEDKKGNILFATPTGLYVNNKNNSNKKIIKIEGLISEDIAGIIEDKDENLWLSTNNGIIKYNPTSGATENYALSDGLQGDKFNPASVFTTKNNELIFGGSNGFNIFKTENIKKNKDAPKVILTALKIFNEEVNTNDNSNILTKHISQTDSLSLSYENNVISFEFNALLFQHPEKVKYAYFLEGFEKDWNYIGHKNNVTYTSLEPGEYALRIKSTNSDGIWNNNETRLHVTITPPFWKTWWFKVLAILILILGVYLFFHLKVKNIKAQKVLLVNKIQERTSELQTQKKQLEKIANELATKNEEIQRFAFSVSHDLKGPLSNIKIITNLIKSTYPKEDFTDLDKFSELIQISCDTMDTLITDITEIAKIGKIENKYELLQTREIIDLSAKLIQNKIENQRIVIDIDDNLPKIFGDKNRFIQVFGNLIGNAVKYMGNQKEPQISVKTHKRKEQIEFHIIDNGSGMNAKELNKLFTPFERFHANVTGTGLGLYMTKKIIESHNGTIRAESEGKEKGTTFIITLPNNKKTKIKEPLTA